MSKGNLFLGLATGKIGSVVLYRSFGEERARSWVARKRNPRTWRQGVQRCVMKTAQVAYSSLMPLCRETFQGFEAGTPCQSAFVSRNVRLLRGRVQSSIDAGRQSVLEDATGNYNGISSELFLLNPLMVSDGGLGTVGAAVGASGGLQLAVPGITSASTYAQVCAALGCTAGDRLDLLFLLSAASGIVQRIAFARLVLSPSSGDMSASFLTEGGALNLPNPGNDGEFSLSVADGVLSVSTTAFSPNAGAVVRSRMFGDLRQYSAEYIALPPGEGYSSFPLGTAVESYLSAGSVYLDGQ